MFKVTKVFGHERGLSCVFRQHRAHSHCRKMHGYALAVTLEVLAEEVDENGWCYDFGAFKDIEKFLHATFDHKVLVAADDPYKHLMIDLHHQGVADLQILPQVGCEAFAKHIFIFANLLISSLTKGRAKLTSVTVSEHAGNSVTYYSFEKNP